MELTRGLFYLKFSEKTKQNLKPKTGVIPRMTMKTKRNQKQSSQKMMLETKISQEKKRPMTRRETLMRIPQPMVMMTTMMMMTTTTMMKEMMMTTTMTVMMMRMKRKRKKRRMRTNHRLKKESKCAVKEFSRESRFVFMSLLLICRILTFLIFCLE